MKNGLQLLTLVRMTKDCGPQFGLIEATLFIKNTGAKLLKNFGKYLILG